MDALADVVLRDRAAVIRDTLILSDLHLGQGERSDIAFPVGDGSDVLDRFEGLCRRFEPQTAVIAGDLLHSFRTIPRTVRQTVEGIEAVAEGVGVDLVVTPGNHDTMLDAVLSAETSPTVRIGETVVCHGHAEPKVDAGRYVVGHDHPAITIEGQKRPCYLAGEGVYGGSDLLVLPAFSRLVAGARIDDMRTEDFLSPLVTDPGALRPIVRDTEGNETLEFPPLGEFRHRL